MPDKCSGSKPHLSREAVLSRTHIALSLSLLLHASPVLYVCLYSYYYYYYYYYCVIICRTRYLTTDGVCLYLKFIDHNWASNPFCGKGLHRLVWLSARAAHVQIAVSGVPNRLNYCVTFIIYTEFTNMAAVRIIQPGGSWVGSPWAVTSRILIVAVSVTVFTRKLFLTRRVEMWVVCTILHVPRTPLILYLSPWDRNRQQIFPRASCHFLRNPGRNKTSLPFQDAHT